MNDAIAVEVIQPLENLDHITRYHRLAQLSRRFEFLLERLVLGVPVCDVTQTISD